MDTHKETNLPIINMELAKQDPILYSKKVVSALETSGFLYIEGVDVDFKQLFSACQWFFALPEETKLLIARQPYKKDSGNFYRGYWPVIKGEASRKEGYEVSKSHDTKDDPRIAHDNWMYEQSPWPPEDGSFPFKQIMMSYYDVMYKVGHDVLRLVAKGVGIPESAFEDFVGEYSVSTMRLIHYPTWKGTKETLPVNAYSEDGRPITTPDHTDTAFLTLLHTFDYEGLERLDEHGKWVPVPCRPNSLVMNIGDSFSRMMNGRFKSTRHRVMDISRDRFSVPFFFEPSFYSDVGVNWISKFSGKDEHIQEPYGPWLINVIKVVKKFSEARFLPDFDYNLDLGPVGFDHENHPPMPPSGSWTYRAGGNEDQKVASEDQRLTGDD